MPLPRHFRPIGDCRLDVIQSQLGTLRLDFLKLIPSLKAAKFAGFRRENVELDGWIMADLGGKRMDVLRRLTGNDAQISPCSQAFRLGDGADVGGAIAILTDVFEQPIGKTGLQESGVAG